LLEQDISQQLKQKIAAEMNLSETAFIKLASENDNFGESNQFGLEWFTPTNEVDLCGHATLASAAILFDKFGNKSKTIEFKTRSGILKASRTLNGSDLITLDFPANSSLTYEALSLSSLLKVTTGDLEILEVKISESTRKLIVRLADKYTRQDLENLKPDTQQMMKLESSGAIKGIIVTVRASENEEYDFFSRYFAPWNGIPEDPVTGSAHTVLAPYWKTILNKSQFRARQCSKRGGDLMLKLIDQRVEITGSVAHVLQGAIHT